MISAKKQAPSPNESFWNFPEDGWPLGPEFLAKNKLLEGLTGFARTQLPEILNDPDGMFCPGVREVMEKGGDSMHDILMINIMDWLLFDRIVDEQGRTNADLYSIRKKLFLPGLQKVVLSNLREGRMEFYEARGVYPGRGFELLRLRDGALLQVVDMKASRAISRWTIIACRIWLLDGVHRLSGSMYLFKPRQKTQLLEAQLEIMAGGDGPAQSRERFSPEICRLWIEPLIHSQPSPVCNQDGDEIIMCKAIFAADDPDAVREKLIRQKEIIVNDSGEQVLDWLSSKKDAAGYPTVLGTFRLQDGELRFECNSSERFQRGMKVLKETLGDSIRLKKEEQVPWDEIPDHGDEEAPEAEEIPAEIQEELITDFMRKHMESWLDHKVPLLGNKTPRQAVRTEAGRAAVAQLLKDFESGEEHKRRRGDPAIDAGFLWRELNLNPEDY